MSFFNNLFRHHESQNVHAQVYANQGEHQSSFTHEIIAGAAGFAALKAYEDHVRRSGEQVNHPRMKEILAEFAAAEVDKLFETKGLDYLDREKAKNMAIEQAHHLAHEKYDPGQVYQSDNFNGYQQNQSNSFNYGENNYSDQEQQQWNYENDQPISKHHHYHVKIMINKNSRSYS
ncbi:hypothetical protein I4U23_022642 [Adineta vaga]|nr:hypothetical protein I4U23_022642 [Adineta vaga]